VWQFPVEVDDSRITHTFTAETNMDWDEFRVLVYARMETPPSDMCLGYRIRNEKRTWATLSCQSDWNYAVSLLREKASLARKRAAVLELRNMVSNVFALLGQQKYLPFWLQKAHEKGKKKEKEKRTRDDDIPPEPTPEARRQAETLHELQRHWYCMAHSKPGIMTYCWIEPADGNTKGGHREIPHKEMTLWAKYIVSKKN
jgi:hypothetical protein